MINKAIMQLFKAYLVNDKKIFGNVNEKALRKGLYISDLCSHEIIDLAIALWGKDGYLLNQTFHKSFTSVVNTPDEELFLQQIIHYLTTYGYEQLGIYDEQNVYIPNENLDIPELKGNIKLIKIKPITRSELKERLWNLCTSSIALNKDTVEYISELSDFLDINQNNIDQINNKEIKVILYDKLNIVPSDPNEFIRYLIYSLTDRTLLIKDRETINSLNFADRNKALSLLQKYIKQNSIEALAEVFNRYKPLFLALKTNHKKDNNKLDEILEKPPTIEEIELNALINKISHLSKKHHKPMKINDLDIFIKWCNLHKLDIDYKEQLLEKLNEAGIWRAIKLNNYLKYERLDASEHVYKIRNGKTWIKDSNKTKQFDYEEVISVLDDFIINRLKENVDGKKIYLDNNIDLKLPQSDKQFIGNIPFGSSLSIDKDSLLVGIKWFNIDNNRVDLDLKIISNEYTIGWNNDYKQDDKLIFSGDITDAPLPNGAAEYIYIDKSIGKTIFSLKINNYTSNVDNVECDIIIAKSNKEQLNNNFIVDPNNILFTIPKIKIEKGKAEHSLGCIVVDENNIKLFFTDLCTSNRIYSVNNELENTLRNYMDKESNSKCSLKEYLSKANAVFVNCVKEADFNLSIDALNKDTIIDLLS